MSQTDNTERAYILLAGAVEVLGDEVLDHFLALEEQMGGAVGRAAARQRAAAIAASTAKPTDYTTSGRGGSA